MAAFGGLGLLIHAGGDVGEFVGDCVRKGVE